MGYELASIGELLIDFAPDGTDERGLPRFIASPGGAPANVCACFAKLGGTAAFLGKVGDDPFGTMLRKTLERNRIGTDGLVTGREGHTSLAFVTLDENGDRDFCFYRKHGADVLFREEELCTELIRESRFFHFGSVSMTDEPARSTTFRAVGLARECGCTVSYDPNYRPPLWSSEKEAKEWMLRGVKLTDILKVSDEEMTVLTGETDPRKGAEKLHAMGPSVVLLTCGADGAYYLTENCFGYVAGIPVRTVDTTGAGDTFIGTFLYEVRTLSAEQLVALTEKELRRIVHRCNAAAAITTTGLGAIAAMPDGAALDLFLTQLPA